MKDVVKNAIEWYESRGVHAYSDDGEKVCIIVYGDEMLDELHVEVSDEEVIRRGTYSREEEHLA